MISTIPSAERYHADHGWLDTHWHFSFADYHDPENLHWSALRVFNDDTIAPAGTFDFHPHRDMEIVSYIVSGELEHRDRLGNKHVNKAGEVQVMSAGTGIIHSERNPSSTTPMRLIQLWIIPRHKGIKPRWEQKAFNKADRQNRLLAVVSAGEIPGSLPIDQDAAVYVSSLDAGKSLTHESGAGRHAYLFVIDGEIELNGTKLAAGDQARIVDETSLKMTAKQNAELILLDLP
jgi:redox-sensitive bicupin YhaK (pirin superfamily)